MKIEVGENLMRSWLRHVKGCQFAELSWKPSASWANYRDTQQFMDEARTYFQDALGADVFEGTKNASQLVKQGEIDVLGIRLGGAGIIECLYGVDMAFHEGGLNYGGPTETTARIAKKLLRSIMVVRTFCGSVNSEFVFASPKVGMPFLNPLREVISTLRKFLSSREQSCEVHLLVNEDFKQQVLAPTLKNSSGTADSSELFLRSYRLLQLLQFGESINGASGKNMNSTEISSVKFDQKATVLPIQFDPANIDEFKARLLSRRKACIIIEYENGSTKYQPWDAEKFSQTSSLVGNLRSRPEFRQGEWQKRGIARLKVVIDGLTP